MTDRATVSPRSGERYTPDPDAVSDNVLMCERCEYLAGLAGVIDVYHEGPRHHDILVQHAGDTGRVTETWSVAEEDDIV